LLQETACQLPLQKAGQKRKKERKKERKKDDSDVATGVNYGVASFFSWSSLYVILKQAL
jgi:hypothetical protein